MALSSVTVFQGVDTFICDIAAAADGDAGELLINHGLLGIPATGPVDICICPLLTGIAATQPYWALTTKNATQIGVTKTAVGAGSAFGGAASARVIVKRPHSIGR